MWTIVFKFDVFGINLFKIMTSLKTVYIHSAQPYVHVCIYAGVITHMQIVSAHICTETLILFTFLKPFQLVLT